MTVVQLCLKFSIPWKPEVCMSSRNIPHEKSTSAFTLVTASFYPGLVIKITGFPVLISIPQLSTNF